MLKKFIKEIFKTAVVTTIFGFPFRADASQTLKQFFTSQLKFYTAITTLSYISAKSSGDTANRNLGIKRAITNPIAPRNIVYGKTRVGGTIVQRTLTAKSASTKNVLHQVIALAGHEINNITKIYIDAGKGIKELDLSDTNDFVSATENSTTVFRCVDPEFANTDNDEAYTGGSLIKLAFEKGDQTTANGYAVAQMSSASAWSTDHKMLGIAYIYINCIYDTEKFTQIPSFSFEIEGKKVFDPVSSSTVYSTNPALIIRDYLMDSTYGFGATSTEINDAVTGAGFVKARSDCNDSVSITSGTESRYTLNGQFTSTEEPQTVLETMLSACAGQLLYNNGVFSLFVGKERTASGTITDDKILEPIQIQTKFSGRELANGVKATYVRPSDEYIAAEITPYKDSTYLTQDTPSGKAQADYENFLNLSFPYTQSSFTAQRLARIALDYQRQNQTLSVLVPLEFLSHQVGDIVNLDNDRLGYSGKDFEIVGMSFEFVGEQYLALRLSLKEYSTTVFNNITYVADPTLPSPPDTGDNTVSSPTGLALAEFTKDSQVRLHFIRASWTNNLDDKIVTTEVAYKKSTDSNFDAADVSYPSNSFSFYVEPATTYNVKVRHISNTGVSSAYTGTVNLTTSGGQVTLTTGTVAGITIESGKLYQGTGTFNNSNTGFFVDSSGQFSLKDKLSFNGTTLNISGNLTVENTITADKIILDGQALNTLMSSTGAGATTFSELTVSNDCFLEGGFQISASHEGIFLDNAKAVFGTGSDLQILHDGSNSIIKDVGTGDLQLLGTNVLLGSAGGEPYLIGVADGAVQIYHDNSQKLATTSTGVTVTGTLAATAVTGDGSGLTNLPSAAIASVTNMSDNRVLTASGSNSLNGEANLTFDGTTLALTGNLTVSGTTTTINTTNLDVADKNITLNFGSGDTSSNANGAGITIQDAVNSSTDATILWDATNDKFDFSHGLEITTEEVTDAIALLDSNNSNTKYFSIQGDNGDCNINAPAGALALQRAGTTRLAVGTSGVTVTGTITAGANSGVIKEIGSDISLVQGAIGLRINDAASAISPTTASVNNDAAVDLGVSNIRFRNLHLSDTISCGDIISTGILKSTKTSFPQLQLQDATNSVQFGHSGNTFFIKRGDSDGQIRFRNIDNTEPFIFDFTTASPAFTTTGTIGIGTNSPTSKLNIDTGSDQGIAIFRTGTNASFDAIQFRKSNNSDLNSRIGFNSNQLRLDGTSDILFGIGSGFGEKMRLNSTGLGIGTSSPSHLLSVGTVGNASGRKISMYLAGSNDAFAGIGAQRGESNLFCSSEIRFVNENNSSGLGALAFATGSNTLTERIRIDSSGRMGIATSSPQSRLDLGASSSSGGGISFGTTLTEIRRSGTNGDTLHTSHFGNVAVLIDSDNNDSSTRAFKVMEGSTDSATANELFRVRSDGRVGIGTSSPTEKLQVNGNIQVGVGNSKEALIQGTNSGRVASNPAYSFSNDVDTGMFNPQTDNTIAFSTAGSERMRIDSSGSVGIATTSPSSTYKLDVNGKVRTQQELLINTGSLFVNQEGEGIHLLSPSGTEYKLTVSNAGALVITEQ